MTCVKLRKPAHKYTFLTREAIGIKLQRNREWFRSYRESQMEGFCAMYELDRGGREIVAQKLQKGLWGWLALKSCLSSEASSWGADLQLLFESLSCDQNYWRGEENYT